jgi:hypothetical protein
VEDGAGVVDAASTEAVTVKELDVVREGDAHGYIETEGDELSA